MSEINALMGEWLNKVEAVAPRPPFQECAAVSVTDAIRQPRNAYRTHGEKSESCVLLLNGRTTETSGSAALVRLASAHTKSETEGEGGSLYGDRNWTEFRE